MIVAMKKLMGVRVDGRLDHGADPSALREIRVLKEISHPNVVGLLDTFFHKRSSARCTSNRSIIFDMML
jgi:cyclin-dependent kinase 7